MNAGSHHKSKRTVFLTPEEVAEWLRISKQTLYRLTGQRRIPFVRVGGAIRFDESDIQEYIERMRTESAAKWR